MKTCSKCKNTKELLNFPKRKDSLDGYRGQCYPCINAIKKDYISKNKEHFTKKRKEWETENKETLKKAKKEYYIANKEHILKRIKLHQSEHREEKITYLVEYRKNHKQLIAQKRKKKYLENRENYLISNRERLRISTLKRRAIKKSTEDGTVNRESLSALKIKQNYKCYYCKEKLDFSSKNGTHLDHVQPLSKGGVHTLDNVVWSCRGCNLSKGAKNPIQFANEIGRLF